jgi:hypothetical protein
MRAFSLSISMFAVALGGCASTVTAWKNDPLQAYDMVNPTVYAMTGDRRTAVMMSPSKDKRFCAESLPDAVAAYSAASKANASLQSKASGGFEDAAYAGLMQTFQRTEIAEVYRQMGWNLCLAWAQGAIGETEYTTLLTRYVEGGIDAISKRAAQAQVHPTIAPVTLNVHPGATVGAGVSAPKTEDVKPATEKSEVDLGGGVKLAASPSASGYCIKAAADYVGTGTWNKPKISEALPRCPAASS